jgi:PAS domain S-box-containing protein
MLEARAAMSATADRGREAHGQPYGDLVELNTCRKVLDAAGQDVLADIANDYLDLLGTSSAIYEADGGYALGIFTSGWCRLLDDASRRLCNTEDNKAALECGKWLCHESCWTDVSKRSIETGQPVDRECSGGIRLYAVPIRAAGEVVGSINFGYGSPPQEPVKLQEIADKYAVEVERLREEAKAYETRPAFVIEVAKRILTTSANLIGRIVEVRRAEEAAQESEGLLKELLAASSTVIYRCEPSGDYPATFISTNIVKQTGYRPEDFTRNPSFWSEHIHPDDRPRVFADLSSLFEEGHHKHEYRFLHSDGTYRYMHDEATLVRNSDGRPVDIVGNWIDITERKQAEKEKEQLEEQIRHAQKLKSLGVLAGGISHDFNNLLMTILGHADLALQGLSPVSPVRPNIQEMESAARRAAALSSQMLAYSGRGHFVVAPLDLSEAVGEMTHLLESSISKKVELTTRLAANLPAINADATQVHQVIMNLITNASEAIGENEIGIITVSTGSRECSRAYLSSSYLDEKQVAGQYVYIEVADTGCGMDERAKETLFDPFFTTKFAGRGLGLSAVLGIVRGHKGAIMVDTEVGKGTTFRVLFPAVAGETKKPTPAGYLTKRDDWRGTGTVLVVDDEASVRRLVVTMVERLGFETLQAANGQDAVEVLRKHADCITCVLLDLTMPRMDGSEACLEIQRIRDDVPIILSSGYEEAELSERFEGYGVAGFIQKPYQTAKLRGVLQSALAVEP